MSSIQRPEPAPLEHALIVVDDRRQILQSNVAACAMFGVDVGGLVGRNYDDLLMPYMMRRPDVATDSTDSHQSIEARLLRALRDDELDVAFQPLTDMQDRTIGVEVLVRWPGSGVSPARLIEVAESSHLIIDIGRFVVRKAMASLPELSEAAGRPLRLSINWAAAQLRYDDLPALLRDSCAEFGIPPEQLCIEITETTAMVDRAATCRTLEAIRDMGVRVAIDDFGIGYSSFSYLSDLPIDEVKVDRSFIQRAGLDRAGVDILDGMTRLCRGMGLEVVGEGVETEHERQIVAASGCTTWQGYLCARPMPARALVEFLADRPEDHPKAQLAGLDQAMQDMGVIDLLVFKKIGEGRYAHIGGRGRGEGWAGIVEVDLACEPQVAELLAQADRAVLCAQEPSQVLGPYYATSAAVVQSGDHLVVFGHPTNHLDPMVLATGGEHLVAAAIVEVNAVSPAKPLADELEVLEAVQTLLRFEGSGMTEALQHLLRVVVSSLSCEVGLVWTRNAGLVTQGIDLSQGINWSDELAEQILQATRGVPQCIQHADDDDLPGNLVTHADIKSWLALPLGEGGVMVVGHTGASPRGFTSLCQRLGRTLVETSDVLFHSAAARDRLREEVAHASTEARTDALTGVLNRKGWDEEYERRRSIDAPTGVVILDVNQFKLLNDDLGHAVGDQVLSDLAVILSAICPSNGVIARLGGDEFGILLADAEELDTESLELRLADALVLPPHDGRPEVSVAVGSGWAASGRLLQPALLQADRAMYTSKNCRTLL